MPETLLPGSTDSHSIQKTPLQIASSGSPVVSLSVSSITSLGDQFKPAPLLPVYIGRELIGPEGRGGLLAP